MGGGKPLSWQWKLVLGGVALGLVFMGYVFTDGCHEYVVGKINREYAETPASERRESAWAWRHLFWAAFKGNVCGDFQAASSMYKDFCGMPKDYKRRAFDYVMSPEFK